MSLRRVLLKIHLYGGLVAAAFLVVAGLTGSILAFGPDVDHWVHRDLWHVTPRATRLSEQALADRVAARLAGNRSLAGIETIEFAGPRLAQVFALRSGARAFVDPYTGKLLGVRERLDAWEQFVGNAFQLHVRLLAGNWGQHIVDVATGLGLVLVIVGLILWWPKKRVTVRWRESWRRVTWDLHNTIGILAGALVVLLSVSGLLLAYDEPLEWLTHSPPQPDQALPHSTLPASGTNAGIVAAPASTAPAVAGGETPAAIADLDELLRAADRALPGAETYRLTMPHGPRSPVQVLKRGPGGVGTSAVFLDRYSGRVLRVDDFRRTTRAYRAHVIDQALHMGTILGLPTRILMSLSSLALVGLVLTGTILWWKRVVR